jgi:phosphohistidine phosphatase
MKWCHDGRFTGEIATMELILWRHAEAEDARRGQSDMKRRLTPRGEKQARLVGRWLKSRLPKNTRIMVSPAMRTQQTVLSLELAYETEERIGTAATPADLLATTGWPNPPTAVLLVGHQPTLGQLASLLLFGAESDLAMKKGAAWWISSKTGGDEIFLRAVLGPDML